MKINQINKYFNFILLLSFILQINSILNLICKQNCQNLVDNPKDIFNIYTKEVIKRSYFLGWQDNLIDLYHNKDMINILAIGGSMTAGFDLPGHSGTWVDVMRDSINSKKMRINVMAGSGQGSDYFSKNPEFWTKLKLAPPDILIVEFGINDQQVGFVGMESRSYPQHFYEFLTHIQQTAPNTQIMALVASRITTDIRKKGVMEYLNKVCATPTEETALTIYTKSDGIQVAWCHNWWHVATIQQTIYRELGIPYFSYRDAIWPFLHTPVDSLTVKWNGESHPDRYAHKLMAMGLLRLITMVCETTCSHPDNDHLTVFDNLPSYTSPEYQIISDKNISSLEFGCETTTATLIAQNFKSISKDAWIFGISEHTHHRFAWRIEDISNNEQNLIMSIKPGPTHKLMFEYLGSHSFYGDVDVYIDTDVNKVKSSTDKLFRLSTFWDRHLSIPQWKIYELSNSLKQKLISNPSESLIYIRLSYNSEFKSLTLKSLPQNKINEYNHTKPLFLLYSISTC